MNLLSRASRALCASLLGLGVVSGTAAAEPGDHIQLGPSTELAPRLEFGLQSRSNLTQSPSDPVAGVSAVFAPGARLKHETPDTMVELDGSYRLVKFFTRRLSGLDQFNDFDVRLDAVGLRSRPVGFVLSNRAALVNNNATDRLGNTPFVTRTRNDLSAGLQIRPGAVLQFDVRGKFEIDSVRVPLGAFQSDTRGLNSRTGYGAAWIGEYRFYPRTAFILEGDAMRFDWQRNVLPVGATGNVFALPDSTHIRLLAGVRGRFTERLVLTGQLGYGVANYSVASVQRVCGDTPGCEPGPGNTFDAGLSGLQRLLVVAQAAYDFDTDRKLIVGYRKDFDDVFFTNFMAYHMLYGGIDTRVGERFRVDGRATVRQEDYRGALAARSDTFLNFDAGATLVIQEWLRFRAGGGYMQRTVPSLPNISFNDVRGTALLIVTY
jgi:hypothetical protein